MDEWILAFFMCCFVSPINSKPNSAEVFTNMYDANCDQTQVEVPSYYTCDEAEEDDVTLSDISTDTWHDGGGRYFRVDQRKACYAEANRTCQQHGGTLVDLDSVALRWIAGNLGDGWYELWTTYRAINKGTVKNKRRTCIYEPLTGRGRRITILEDKCYRCECVFAWITVQDGVLRKEYRQHHCNRPLSFMCQKRQD
ncbi:hypothetical protein AAVH_24283 [Aphelenchoides avenae]|nr:hypothetical protein AAVH_24283 [Aphelenchus avenae]